MSNFVRYLISDFLDIVQVEDLRNNLNAINNATREVLLESNLTKLVCVNVFFPKLKCPTFFFFFLQVKESGKLRQIMQTILTLGNALNQGTARGTTSFMFSCITFFPSLPLTI